MLRNCIRSGAERYGTDNPPSEFVYGQGNGMKMHFWCNGVLERGETLSKQNEIVVRSRMPSSVSLAKSNTFSYLFEFIFVRAN